MSVNLFNKSKRPIQGNHPDGKPFAFMPETGMTFDDATAKKLQRLFKGEVISMGDLEKQFTDSMDKKAPEATAILKPATAPPEKTLPLTLEEKEQVRIELTELLKRLKARGMDNEEIETMAGSAEIAAEMEMKQPAPEGDETLHNFPVDPAEEAEPKKGLIRRLLDGLA